MRKIGNSILIIMVRLMERNRDDAFYSAVDSARKNDEEAIKKAEEEYCKAVRGIELGYEMLLGGVLAGWEWTWLAKNGHLCKKDFEWFGEDLKKAGITSYDDYIKNWYKETYEKD